MADRSSAVVAGNGQGKSLVACIKAHIETLKVCRSSRERDRRAAWRAAHALAEIANHNDLFRVIVKADGVPALIPHLSAPLIKEGGESIFLEHKVEREAAKALELIAKEPKYKMKIVHSDAIPLLVALLLRRVSTADGFDALLLNGTILQAARTISVLADKNADGKRRVRMEDGIPPLVALLKSTDTLLQQEALEALRILAYKNSENKILIADQNLGTLIFMLESSNIGICRKAIGALSSLVDETRDKTLGMVRRRVLWGGALKPIVYLLSSRCQDIQILATRVLSQLAWTSCESYKKPWVIIVQYGGLRPLLMLLLKVTDTQIVNNILHLIRLLSRDDGNTIGIVLRGGLKPLLSLLQSKNGSVQEKALSIFLQLTQAEDNVHAIVLEGGVQVLKHADFINARSKDLAHSALDYLEWAASLKLDNLIYLMRSGDGPVQETVACALAHLCAAHHQQLIFIKNSGINILLKMLSSFKSSKQQQYCAQALFQLVTKKTPLNQVPAAVPRMTPPVEYLGEQYVNNASSSDVTFLVEDKPFYAHKVALSASSETFKAMLHGGYREKETKVIEIPNIAWNVFELLMKYIYTGTVEVSLDMAQDLFQAADQYLLEDLKKLCEDIISKGLTVENAAMVYGLAEAHQALSLKYSSVLFILKNHEQFCDVTGYPHLIQLIIPGIRDYLEVTMPAPRLGRLIEKSIIHVQIDAH